MSRTLHSTILGNGRPLIILHGFLGMSDNWKTLGTRYSKEGFEVHLVDQRNHGRSFWSTDFDYDFLANDINRYLREKGIEKASIIGHSMGGKTAMQFACTFSGKAHRLIVADIAPKFYPPHHQTIINALVGMDLKVATSRKEADIQLAKSIRSTGVRQFLLKNLYWREKGQLGFRCNLKVLSRRMEEIGENLLGGASFDGKTLFLRGDRSEYVADADMPTIKTHFKNAQLLTVANAGHWLHAENPEQFFELSLSFLND